MARVDFYVLGTAGEPARRRVACRLVEKAYRQNHRIRILADDARAAGEIDELLWTWREGSFVPHEVVRADTTPQAPVTIACDAGTADPAPTDDLLINLSEHYPAAGAFPRIAEIVTSDADQRRRSREHYARYRDDGHELDTHNI